VAKEIDMEPFQISRISMKATLGMKGSACTDVARP
jgi:hypothetical protein